MKVHTKPLRPHSPSCPLLTSTETFSNTRKTDERIKQILLLQTRTRNETKTKKEEEIGKAEKKKKKKKLAYKSNKFVV